VTVEITNVRRVNGKAVMLTALIGDIEIGYARPMGSDGVPQEISRLRYGVQVLDIDTLSIPDADYRQLQEQVNTIFSEDRSKPRSPKKTPAGVQGKLF